MPSCERGRGGGRDAARRLWGVETLMNSPRPHAALVVFSPSPPPDINECLESPCFYECRNTDGNYECICLEGMLRLSDRKTCVGNPLRPNNQLTGPTRLNTPTRCQIGYRKTENGCMGEWQRKWSLRK